MVLENPPFYEKNPYLPPVWPIAICRLGLCRRQTAIPSDTGNGIAAGNLTGLICSLQKIHHYRHYFFNFSTSVQQQEQAEQLHPKNFGMLEGSNYTFENWDGGGRKWDKYFTSIYVHRKLGVDFFQTYGKMARELSKQWPRSRTSRTESKILGRGQNSSDEICLQVVNSHHPLSSPSLYWKKKHTHRLTWPLTQ